VVQAAEDISVVPQIMLLEQLLNEMAVGTLRVPRFQRPFVWRPEQMLNLFDSIERGYPIGSLLVWESPLAIPSLSRIADIEVPPAPSNAPSGYLLDGHQRLSTLFGSLMHRPASSDPETQNEWMWRIYRILGERDDGSSGFRHWRRAGDPPGNYLPMRVVLRTMDFLSYSRQLSGEVGDPAVLDELIDEAEELAHRIKSYQLAVVRLKGGDLRHAVEVFSRLNSSGQSMSPDQMVSALSYQAESDSLAERIEAIGERVAASGYGQIPSITIFRSVLAVAGEKDVMNARWEVLADRVKGNLAEATADTEVALMRAVAFLRDEVRVPLARLIPYQHQMMLLTAFFHLRPQASNVQRLSLQRWFWGTSWSGFFAGANTTQIKNALAMMTDFADERISSPWEPQAARPFPDKFDLRSARVRAFILWELAQFSERFIPGYGWIDPVKLLAGSDAEAYQHVVWGVPSVSHPANRLIYQTHPGISVRSALQSLSETDREAVLSSHCIPATALELLQDGDGEGFILERAKLLARLERAFIEDMNIEASRVEEGETDIDTE
jgi:Protein of unknown function DUF262